MISADQCYRVFERSIRDYHQHDDINAGVKSAFISASFEDLLYRKNWIDTVQWHLEDIIRDPQIDPEKALAIKRRIDKSNQDRTDMVEKMDDYFLEQFKGVTANPSARINSETPAWLLDRMSILMLKIYHMQEQTERKDVPVDHILRCRGKLEVLLEQKTDMQHAFDELIQDIASGNRRFKVYRQMKMYNDSTLNPMLYNTKRPTE